MGVGAVIAQSSSSSGGAGAAAGMFMFLLIGLALFLVQVVGMWKTFEKAGQKGWLSIIPILNSYVLIKIAGRESWWIILYFIPCVSFIVQIIVCMDVAPKFGKSSAYGIGLALMPIIFFPMLGFSDAQYQGDRTPIF